MSPDALLIVAAYVSTVSAVAALVGPLKVSAMNGDLTFDDVLRLLKEFSLSVGQMRQQYEWRISQWAAFSTTVLTATLGFVSTLVVEYLKTEGSPIFGTSERIIGAYVGVTGSAFLYLYSQRRISELRREWLQLYSLLCLLKH